MGQFEDIFMKMHQKLLILQGTDTGRWEPLGQKGWQGKNNKIQVMITEEGFCANSLT